MHGTLNVHVHTCINQQTWLKICSKFASSQIIVQVMNADDLSL